MVAEECHKAINSLFHGQGASYRLKYKFSQLHRLFYPRDHPRSIAFHQKHFSDYTVTDKGPHHRCCYLEKHMYSRKSILKGSHHRRFHRKVFTKYSSDNLCCVLFEKIKVQAVLLEILFTNCFTVTRV